MHDNNLYNLMLQLTVEERSLWRIKKEYIADATNDEDALRFWQDMAKDKEAHVAKLTELVKKNL